MDTKVDLSASADLDYTPWYSLLFNREVMARGWRGRATANWKVETGPRPENPLWLHEASDYSTGCYEMEGGLASIRVDSENKIWVEVATESPDASGILAEVRKLYPEAPPPPDHEVAVDFWMAGSMGPKKVDRQIEVPTWDEIADNYPAVTRKGIEPLFGDFRPASGGRMILWHGEPGTGKTFAIRALARDWKPWCGIDYVTDPEQFFGSAAYMTDVLLGQQDPRFDAEPDKAWRLVVLEDAGELMSSDAGLRAGQGLSRLLNVTDGLIGQGLKVLVLITTNEEIGSLHAAVSRPGRCLSSVEFQPLNQYETSAWLGTRGFKGDTSPGTVAELYARLDAKKILARPKKSKVGFAA